MLTNFFKAKKSSGQKTVSRKKPIRVIAITNQKGGCGKTTTAINLAACLGELGQKVLLIDLDPQAHATIGLNINNNKLERTIFDVLTSNKHYPVDLDDVTIEGTTNVDVAPANIKLSTIEQLLAGIPGRDNILYLKLQALSRDYDLVIIDCPPNIGVLTFNALRACSEVIVPVEPSFFSMHGLGKLFETIELFKDTLDHEITIRVLPTIFDKRTRFAQEVVKELGEKNNLNVFSSAIHVNVKLKEAASKGLPITVYDRKASGFRDYMVLAEEVVTLEVFNELRKTSHQQPEQGNEYPINTNRGVIFAYRNEDAGSVRVTGDFNDWCAEGEELQRMAGTGFFRGEVKLTPGRYRYKLIVDNEWIKDPNNSNIIKSPMGDLSFFEYLSENDI